MTIETRNLGLFLLYNPQGGEMTRAEIYNLERRREYSGYPVYWLGRAGNEESLNFMRQLIDAAPAAATHASSLMAERATLAVGLHDDARVGELLKTFVRTSPRMEVRSSAVHWLGQVGGETDFLAALVRDEKEHKDLRENAAHAIGASRDRSALAALQSLYETVSNREVRHSLIHAAANNTERDAAYAFILKIAKSDPDRESRQLAVHRLGEFERESVVDDLMKIYDADRDREVRSGVVHALSEQGSPRASAKLLEIARSSDDPNMRAQAIHRLGERDSEATVDDLMRIYESDRSTEVRSQILHAFSEMSNGRAEERLFEIARRTDNRDMRRQAIHWIGERAGQRSLNLLTDTVNSSAADIEVQMQAVHAISERPAEESVPLLIKIARTHPNQQVRRRAIQVLGESGDPRALEFFREVLSKE